MGGTTELPDQRGRTTKSAAATSATWHEPRMLYLTAYNILFASLWASVFVKVISHASDGKTEFFAATEPHARWIQTVSLIEVLHAAFGISIHPPMRYRILTTI
jgi:very-long-chain (3R)-3-hydroxyacyl-CoA dehydratase